MQLPYIPGFSFCDHCGWICGPDGACLNADCESNIPTAIVPILQLPRDPAAADVLATDLVEYASEHHTK